MPEPVGIYIIRLSFTLSSVQFGNRDWGYFVRYVHLPSMGSHGCPFGGEGASSSDLKYLEVQPRPWSRRRACRWEGSGTRRGVSTTEWKKRGTEKNMTAKREQR